MPHTTNTIEALQAATASTLAQLLRPGETVALLDFPRHFNAGDSLIWQGVRSYLRRAHVSVGYVGTLHHFVPTQIRSLVPEGSMLINGGGNFGDRWIEQQAYKEAILGEFPDRRIIQLPQTIEFSTEQGLRRAQSVVRTHSDFVLMVRDGREVEATRDKFPTAQVIFAPDMALGNGYLARSGNAVVPIVVLKREDSEASGQRVEPAPDLLITDWHWRGLGSQLLWRGMRAPEDAARIAPVLTHLLYPMSKRGLDRMAVRNVREAVAILSQGRVVVTDRLHAMVLAALLGIPVFAFDNVNGKVGALYRDYLHQLPGVMLCETADEAITRARVALADGYHSPG